jgi:hypothetical protein
LPHATRGLPSRSHGPSRNATFPRAACVFLPLATAAGCALGPPRAAAAEAPAAFTVVALPDTQYYAADHPEIFQAQTRWIVEAHAEQQIALVVHEGDIVDRDVPPQWERAAASLHRLDGVVPYLLSSGNHDYRDVGGRISRDTLIDRYFPVGGFEPRPWFQGTYETGHIENSFGVVEMGGGRWLVLSLEFGPRDAVLAWADRIAKRYAQLPAIVVTHAYLDADGSRYDGARGDQLWNPHRYLGGGAPGDVNDGEEMWRKLVSRNANILFVLCGHDLGDGVARLTNVRADGSRVHQLLANYQMGELGGAGYLRLLRFDPAARRVAVRTYSPYLDRFKTDADNEFDLDY